MIKSLIFVFLLSQCSAFRNRLRLYPPHVDRNVPLPPDLWFEQKLDHFDPTNTQTWQQRYQVNETLVQVKRNAPVFIMIGGEGEINAEWMVRGAWLDYAEKYGALCFQLEHRFYGKSHPTPDMSTSNLRYLSSEQALADLAYFIEGMNKKYGLTEQNKWVAFGGSYPGSLAAWLRYKYPHLVHAAISTSGPLLAKADFKEYNEVVQSSLATFNDDCVASVRQAVKHFDKLVKQPAGADLLKTKFKLCSDLNVENSNDVSTLAEALSGNFAGVVQYNKDNRMTKDPMSKITIDDLCTIMVDRAIDQPLDRYAAVNALILNINKNKCLNFTYEQSIKDLQDINWSDNEGAGGRQWIYQTCTEFGFYQTSSSPAELFGSNMPLKYYTQQCKDIYGPGINENVLNEGIRRTNIIYGDLHLFVKRVLFVHGSIDPWHALGIIVSHNKASPAIYINGTAHCANMYPAKPDDPAQLKNARVKISNHIGAWLSRDSD